MDINMKRVRSISNHPYGGRMRCKGVEYDVADADVDLLVTLSRVVVVSNQVARDDGRAYQTRELEASTPFSAVPARRRRSTHAIEPPPAAES